MDGVSNEPKKNWLNIQMDHLKPNRLFDGCTNENLKEVSNWIITQLLLEKVQQHKKN